ncbi:hypothetical protein PFNF135_04104 [Plasmodium falciparum NF135/5.C10]|uniref:Uncharacterized protein n=2 Tax=Plasmodium falciparum TaxID=5833 RepID=A0A024WMB7_PLAFA|nr:hypothetical protein PFNF135_04104 [Plasmodium falciparum NF135/5.C10]ETW48133.1 hypothetical protein PFMALIP_03840 [Plasmodium falciparum MaliPS096_E11]
MNWTVFIFCFVLNQYEYVKKKKKNEENPQKLQLKGYSQWIFLIMNNNNNNNKRNY